MRRAIRICVTTAFCALVLVGPLGAKHAAADQPVLDANDVVQNEGDSGTTTFTFTITKTGSTTDTVSVNYSETGNLGVENQWVDKRGKVTFAPNETEKQVEIEVVADTVPEGTDQFHFNLYGPENATTSAHTAVGVIVNDDIELSVQDLHYAERDEEVIWFFAVHRKGANVNPITFDYATADGTAKAPADYKAASGTITIPYNSYLDTDEFIAVYVQGDDEAEPDETFTVKLSNVSGADAVKPNGHGTIDDNDGGVPPEASPPPKASPTPAPRSTPPPPDSPIRKAPKLTSTKYSPKPGTPDADEVATTPRPGTSPTPKGSPGKKVVAAASPGDGSDEASDTDSTPGSNSARTLGLAAAGVLVVGAGGSIAFLRRRRLS